MRDILEDIWEYLKLKVKHIWNHLCDFYVIWILLFLLLDFFCWFHFSTCFIYVLGVLFVLYMLIRPMSTVYCLVGSSASIRTFLTNFFLITFLFSLGYYGLFFRDAGFCNDGDNPALDYSMFENHKGLDVLTRVDTTRTIVFEERVADGDTISEEVIRTSVDTVSYHRVSYKLVLKNSFLTSLTQGPSDFFFIISDFGEGMNTCTNDSGRTALFSVILTLHVLISWLFLGVFISLLYSKFRYEA